MTRLRAFAQNGFAVPMLWRSHGSVAGLIIGVLWGAWLIAGAVAAIRRGPSRDSWSATSMPHPAR